MGRERVSQENMEIVEAFLDAFNRGDVNAMFQDAPPGLELDWTRGEGPQSGLYRLDQAKRFVEEFRENWDCTQIEPDEFIEAGEHVVVPVTLHNRGREGIEVRARPSFVFTIRDAEIVRVSMYQERQDALEAVGLRKADSSPHD